MVNQDDLVYYSNVVSNPKSCQKAVDIENSEFDKLK